MTRYIAIPASVTPLLHSGLELVVWRLAEELDQAFETRGENHGWFEGPLDRLDRTCELLRVIDWPQDHPPTEGTVEIDAWRDILLGGLEAELKTQRDHRDAAGNSTELREQATRAIATIERFLAKLPALEAEAQAARKPTVPYTSPSGIQRAIVLQVLRHDHAEEWSRAELERELYDVEALSVSDALVCLSEKGAIHLNGEQVKATACARHLDALGMVSI